MVKDAVLGKEVVVTVANEIGILAKISKVLADHGINIEALAGYAVDDDAKIMMVTDDALRAADALKKAGYKSLKEKDVVVVVLENKPGAMKGITAKLASEKIDIRYMYGTTCPEGCPARIVLATSDNEKALISFKKK